MRIRQDLPRRLASWWLLSTRTYKNVEQGPGGKSRLAHSVPVTTCKKTATIATRSMGLLTLGQRMESLVRSAGSLKLAAKR